MAQSIAPVWTLHKVTVRKDGVCAAQSTPGGLPTLGEPCLEISGAADLEFGRCFDPYAGEKIIKAYRELVSGERAPCTHMRSVKYKYANKVGV